MPFLYVFDPAHKGGRSGKILIVEIGDLSLEKRYFVFLKWKNSTRDPRFSHDNFQHFLSSLRNFLNT